MFTKDNFNSCNTACYNGMRVYFHVYVNTQTSCVGVISIHV